MERDDIVKRIEEIDPYSHVDVVHLVKKGIGDILFYDENIGIVVRHPKGTVFAVPFSSKYEKLYQAMGRAELFCVHSEDMCRHLRAEGYSFYEPCYTYSYHGEPLDEGPYSFRLMRLDELDLVKAHYDASESSLIYDLEKGNIFCITDGPVIMGFCGFHSEDSMGLLEIFPEYRRKGLGTYMESHVINEAIRRGQVPFCNVYLSNTASQNLQKKLGLVKGSVLSYWLWLEEDEL